MKSMIWKELRENALYGLLLLIASVATIVVLMNSEFTNRLNLRLFAIELPLTFNVMGSIAAVVLACLQTIPELWPDRWAFLIHRGMSGGAIFRAKTTAALVIYAMVTGLPLLIAILWAMSVGYRHYPFEWRMVLPSVLSGVASFGCYFVVYHVVLRERGFPLWRVLPIALPLAAVGANLALFSNNHYAVWSSAAIVFPLTALGGMVAYRTMVSHGAMQDFGATPGRCLVGTNFVTLGVLLGCGLGCAWFVADWVVFDVLGVVRSETSESSRTSIAPWVDIDGEVMESSITRSLRADATHGYTYKLSAIRNLSHPESNKYSEFVGQEKFWSDWEDKLPFMSLASTRLRNGAGVYPTGTPFFQELRQLGPILPTQSPKNRGPAGQDQIIPLRHLTWQLSATNGVILGYAQERLERSGNRVIRSPQELKYVIGPDGIFEYPKWPAQRFGKCLASATDFNKPDPENWNDFSSAPEFRPAYLFENGLFEIDLGAKTVRALFTPPAGKTIRNVDMFGDLKDQMAVFVDGEVLVCRAVPHSIGRRWSGGSVAVASESKDAGDASTGDDVVAAQPMASEVPRADDNTTYEWKLEDIELLIPGDVVATIPVPDEIDSFTSGSVGYDADRNTAWFNRGAGPWTGTRRIVELDLSSQKTRTFREGVNNTDLGSWEVGKVASFAAIAPLAPVAAFFGFEETRHFATGVSLAADVTHTRPAWFMIAAAVLILSAVLWSYVGKRYAIRFGIDPDKHRRWQLIGLLLGPAGILAMVTAHYCPSRVRCSHCHRRRVVTRELCEHCDAKFAEPNMNGTEILVGAAT